MGINWEGDEQQIIQNVGRSSIFCWKCLEQDSNRVFKHIIKGMSNRYAREIASGGKNRGKKNISINKLGFNDALI